MIELVNKKRVLKAIRAYDDTGYSLETVKAITDGIAREIECIPSVTTGVSEHGYWIKYHGAYGDIKTVCSVCGKRIPYVIEPSELETEIEETEYCPNCGAIIDEGSASIYEER